MKVYVIGAGPAGIMAALSAARSGKDVVLIEKNEKIGKKLYITGKGRCNLTNCSSFDNFMSNIVGNPKFLFSSLRAFDCNDTMRLVEEAGTKLTVERGNRVFPESGKSSDIIKAFSNLLKESNVEVHIKEKLTKIILEDNRIVGIHTDNSYYNDVSALVIATGGMSYPATGSTGDGYKFAAMCGHRIVETVPALTGLYLNNLKTYFGELPWKDISTVQGISLKNVRADIRNKNGKTLFSEFGEMLFTDKGVSGPIILSLSSRINRLNYSDLTLSIDLKPALNNEELDSRVLRDFQSNVNKELKNSLGGLTISALIPLIIKVCGIKSDKKVNVISKEERARLVGALKDLRFGIVGAEPIERAVVTAGGVDVSEVEPSTMRSKKIENLYIAGEVLDVDALTGGYNIQLALSTGYCAGSHIK